MSAASEATLTAILDAARLTNSNIENLTRLLSRADTSGDGGGGGPFKKLTLASTAASVGLAALEGAASAVAYVVHRVGEFIGSFITGLTDTVKNLHQFSLATANGTATLSEFYSAFKDLPFYIGTVAGLYSSLIKVSEEQLDVYRQVSSSGASFGGSLMQMVNYAQDSGMSLKSFGDTVKRNSAILSTYEYNVDAGAKTLARVNKSLLEGDTGNLLLGLGYTAEETAEGVATMMAAAQGYTRQLTPEELTTKTGAYLLELDMLSKVTGQSRDELEKKMKKDLDDQFLETWKTSLTDGQRQTFEALLLEAHALGPAAEDAVKLGARGIFAPITDAGSALQLAGGNYVKLAQTVKEGLDKNPAEALRIFGEQAQIGGNSVVRFQQNIRGAADLALQQQFAQVAGFQKLGLNFLRTGESFNSAASVAKRQQADQIKKDAAELARTEQDVKYRGLQLLKMFTDLIAPFIPAMQVAVTAFLEAFKTVQPALKTFSEFLAGQMSTVIIPMFTKMTSWLTETLTYLAGSANGKDFWFRFSNRLIDGVQNMWEGFKPIWQSTIKPALLDLFDGVFEYIVSALRRNSKIGWLFSETTSEKEQRANDLRSQIANTPNDDINGAAMGKAGLEHDLAVLEKEIAEAKKEKAERWNQNRQNTVNKLPLDAVNSDSRDNTPPPKPKARGGVVNPGTYLVGEKGPEVLNIGAKGDIITNENLSALIANMAKSDPNNMANMISKLNNTMVDVLKYSKETAEYARRNVEATKSLSGDLWG